MTSRWPTITRLTSASARAKVLRKSATRSFGESCCWGAAPIVPPSSPRLMNQIAIARRHELLLVGRNRNALLLQRSIGVGRCRSRPLVVSHRFALARIAHFGWQPERNITGVANIDRRSLFAQFVEALVTGGLGKFTQVCVTLRALVVPGCARIAPGRHPVLCELAGLGHVDIAGAAGFLAPAGLLGI